MSLQLDLQLRSILEGPFDDICVWGSSMDGLSLGQSGPKVGEAGELDVVPNSAERSGDDS